MTRSTLETALPGSRVGYRSGAGREPQGLAGHSLDELDDGIGRILTPPAFQRHRAQGLAQLQRRAVQEYLLNEVQEVYRLQGVRIADKHIGVIVRQMLQKVRVTDPGDTSFLEAEAVDKLSFREENERVVKRKSKPSTAEPLLLGVTKASLTTQSFISAASFQETTRVLTDAAIRGAKDDLRGLKENIIIGHLIPAGTGHYRYVDLEIQPPPGFEPPPPPTPEEQAAAAAAASAVLPLGEEVEAL